MCHSKRGAADWQFESRIAWPGIGLTTHGGGVWDKWSQIRKIWVFVSAGTGPDDPTKNNFPA